MRNPIGHKACPLITLLDHVTAWRITLRPAPTIHFKWTTFPKTIIGSENAINRYIDRYCDALTETVAMSFGMRQVRWYMEVRDPYLTFHGDGRWKWYYIYGLCFFFCWVLCLIFLFLIIYSYNSYIMLLGHSLQSGYNRTTATRPVV